MDFFSLDHWWIPVLSLVGAGLLLLVVVRLRSQSRAGTWRQVDLQLRRIMDNSPEALVILDVTAGRFSALNDRAVALFGWPMDRLLEMGVSDVSPAFQPDGQASGPAAMTMVRKAIDGGMPVFPWVHRNAAGQDISCEIRLVRIPHENRVLVRGSVVDVTERLRAEEELQRSEQRLRAVVNSQHELVFQWLPDGTRTFVNQAFCRFFDCSEEEVLGTSFLDELHEAGRSRVLDKVRSLTTANPVIVSEVEIRDQDGQGRWVEWSDSGIFDSRDQLVEIQAVGRDITDRIKVQQDLENTRSLLTAAVEASPAGIIIADGPDGKIRVANKAVMQILGAGAGDVREVVDQSRQEGYYRTDGTRIEISDLPMHRALKEGVITRPTEMRMRGADGHERWIANSGAPVRNAAGEIIAGIAVATDITDIKRTQLAIRSVAASVSAVTGKEFCEALVLQLSKVLGTDASLIVRVAEAEGRNQILALAIDGETTRLYPEYTSRGSPSGEVIRRGRSMTWDNVQESFPEDPALAKNDMRGYVGVPLLARDRRSLGMLAVLSRKPMEGVPFKIEILNLFAVRAAAELERERTALALVQSEERFRTAFEEAPIGAVILDRNGWLRRVNKSFCRIIGYSARELGRRRLGDLMQARQLDWWANRKTGVEDQAGDTGEGSLMRADGTVVWVNYSARSMPDPSGETLHLVMIEDVSARKQAEQDLQVSRDLQAIVAEVSAGFAGAPGAKVDPLIDQALARVGELLDLDRISLYRIDDEVATLTHFWHRDGTQPPFAKLSLATQVPFLGRAFSEGRVVSFTHIDELAEEHRVDREAFNRLGTRSFLAVPAKLAGSLVGVCALATTRVHRNWPPDLVQWMRVFGDMLAGTAARKSAEERQAASRRQLRGLTHELSRVEDEERRRCAIYLHDQIGQLLAVMRMKLGELLESQSEEERRDSVTQLRGLIEKAIDDTQTLTFDLSPPVLYELGLAAAIEWVGEKICRENGIDFKLKVTEEKSPIPPSAETASIVFRAVRELLVNVVKHGGATGVEIQVERTGAGMEIIVRDDGVGFDIAALAANKDKNRFGLFSIRERLDFIGGRFSISSRPSHGTRASLFVPVQSRAARQGSVK